LRLSNNGLLKDWVQKMIYLQLFWEFFKTGLFAVGGGLATLPFLYDIASKTGWFSEALIADMLAISESTPGAIGVNMSTYTGFITAGFLGGIVATLGLVTPSIVVIIIVAKFLTKFDENKYVKSAFYGLRPTSTALIAAAGFEVFKTSLFKLEAFAASQNIIDVFNIKAIILFAVLFVAVKKIKLHPAFFIAVSGIVGIIFNFAV